MKTTERAKAMLAKLADASSHTSTNPMDAFLASQPRYAKPSWELTKLVVKRQWHVITSNKTFIKARIGQNLIMGLIIGALMFQIKFADYCG